MAKQIGLTAPGEPRQWEGPLILRFRRHEQRIVRGKTVRYGAADQPEFRVYLPSFMLGRVDREAPEYLQMAIDRSAAAVRTPGFGGNIRPLTADLGACEFAFDRAMVNSKQYRMVHEGRVFRLYVPNQVFGDEPHPDRLFLRILGE